ncbi:MAG TPA: PAS domain S-box protein [Chitinophagaceae bacterium]|nr:PAS domain S-box protein [Chitinophagaceae bacterium]
MLDLFEKTLDLVCVVNKDGWFRKINPAVVNTLGYSYEELLSMPVSDLIHPDDRGMTATRRTDLLNNIPLLNFQNRYIAKSGNIVWLEWTSIYIPENEVVFAIAKNITGRKESEIEIEENYKKYKGLAAHFKHHVEKDRMYFATELHEELAQLAAVIKMDLELVSSQHDENEVVKKRLEHGLTTTQLLIDKIRKLSYSISPAKIEDLGLDNVLKALCHEFSSLTGIPSNYQSNYRESLLEHEVKLDLLRICQEALLNVMYHAEATEVSIKLEEKKNKIKLTVSDNGRGFSQKSKKSFGLKNMQGRADSINGEFSIQSEISKGTKVSVSVNAKSKKNNGR